VSYRHIAEKKRVSRGAVRDKAARDETASHDKEQKARLLAAPSKVNLYYFKFIRLRVLFGQGALPLTIVFCVDWKRGYFGQGLTGVPELPHSNQLRA